MNGKVRCMTEDGIVGKFGVEGINDNWRRLLNICRYMHKGNMNFKHKLVHKYTWYKIDEDTSVRSVIDYVMV